MVYSSVPVHGVTQLGFRSHPTGSFTPEAITRHFHSLGLTNRFTCTPPRRSDPLVLHNFYGRLYPGLWCHMGDSQILELGPVKTTSSTSTVWSSGSNFGPLSLGFSFTEPPSYDRYRQHYSSVLYQQTGRDWSYQQPGRDPIPHPVTSSSGSVPTATNSEHSHLGQIHS